MMPRQIRFTVLVLLVGLFALAVTAPAAHAADLVLKRVLLSSGGVGYFEYEAEVVGDATLELDVRLDQVDDVLKSLVVFDDKGGVGAIRLPGREPLAHAFRDLPFDQSALGSPVLLLSALKGAEISVSGGRELTGRLISVEPETTVLPLGQGTTTHHRVSVLTATGVQQFLLEEQDSVRFTDAGLQAEIDEALLSIAEHRVQDRRLLTIAAPGDGARRVRVGYVVEVPLWKASYRLSLGDADGHLQGWAVIENLSGQHWDRVELTMVSGNPVTFRQALYTAYFVDRPEVPVEVLGRVLPPADEGGVKFDEDDFAMAEAELPQVAGALSSRARVAEQAMDVIEPPAPKAISRPALAAAREEATTQVLFRLADPISVDSGESVLVPVIDSTVPATAIALYQPDTHQTHPLAAVRLDNATGTGLPPGVLTLYEAGTAGASYVGDARLAPLPSDDSRLLSFAVDQAILIDREHDTVRTIVGSAISRGVLRLSMRQRANTKFRIKSSAKESRQLLIEHPRRAGWELTAPSVPGIEHAASVYRVPTEIAPGAEQKLAITLETTLVEEVSLDGLRMRDLAAYAATGALEPEVRQALERLAQLRGDVDEARGEIERLEETASRLHRDQERLRANLREVPRDSDLHRRYLAKMTAQEDSLDKLGSALVTARDTLTQTERTLADAIRDLEV
jgi:hypothetical protein